MTAKEMFEALGYVDTSYTTKGWLLLDKSYTTKGWLLLEKDFGAYIEEIRIDILTGDYKKSRVFFDDKKMWSANITKEEHEAITQQMKELGWLE